MRSWQFPLPSRHFSPSPKCHFLYSEDLVHVAARELVCMVEVCCEDWLGGPVPNKVANQYDSGLTHSLSQRPSDVVLHRSSVSASSHIVLRKTTTPQNSFSESAGILFHFRMRNLVNIVLTEHGRITSLREGDSYFRAV